MASLYDLTKGESRDLDRILDAAGLDASVARRLIKQPELAEEWVARLRYQLAPLSVELFCPPETQMAQLMRWNTDYNLGFTSEQFTSLGAAPAWPVDHLVVVVLAWSLDTPERTAQMAWRIAAGRQVPIRRVPSDQLDFEPRLAKGITFTPHTLRWQIIDLGANCNPEENQPWFERLCKQSSNLAHAQVLQAAAYFPQWVREMGSSSSIPCVYLGGYRAATLDGEYAAVPVLVWSRGSYTQLKIQLHATWRHQPGWAIPTCLKTV
jgi:hypothetical protein